MARKPKALVFDSWAILSYLEDEQSADTVANLIAGAQGGKQMLYLATVAAAEVWSIVAKAWSANEADRAIAELQHLGIQLTDVSWPIAGKAASLSIKSGASLADCISVALAIDRKADLVSGNRELRQFEATVSLHLI